MGHSELNAIEFLQAQMNTEVAQKSTKFKITDVKALANISLENVTVKNWENVTKHIPKKLKMPLGKLTLARLMDK